LTLEAVESHDECFSMAERSMPVDRRKRTLFLQTWYADATEYSNIKVNIMYTCNMKVDE